MLMMNSVMSSDLVRFEVGPSGQPFNLHSAIVAYQSPSLSVLLKGSMREATERRVVWNEVDVATFLCFSQYVYTGDYHAVKSQAQLVQESEASTAVSLRSCKPEPLLCNFETNGFPED